MTDTGILVNKKVNMNSQTELQATQQIINVFEHSKEQCEIELEALPGIYAIVDASGAIYKGNVNFAKLMSINLESLLHVNINTLFSDDEWKKFEDFLLKFSEQEKPHAVEFQMDIHTQKTGSLNYLWSIRIFETSRNDIPILYSIIGRDVSEVRRATASSARLTFELDTAKIVQESFFPTSSAKFGESSICGFYESATECGGDWWYYSLLDKRLLLWIGDVTGHGVAAAIVVGAVHAAVSLIKKDRGSVASAMEKLDEIICLGGRAQRLMTMCIVSVDLETGDCVYCSASHEPPILLSGALDSYSWRDLKFLFAEASTPLGSVEKKHYTQYDFKLSRGDRLFLYTDGIYDVRDPDGGGWTRSIFRKELASIASRCDGVDLLVDGFRESIEKCRRGSELVDDVTFFAFQF